MEDGTHALVCAINYYIKCKNPHYVNRNYNLVMI